MVHALLTIASSESSKTAFYVAGSALAVWAVALAAIGMTQPSFPSSEGAARGVMLISAVLVVAAMAMTIVTA